MSLTVMVKVSLSMRLPLPLSVTVMVTDGVSSALGLGWCPGEDAGIGIDGHAHGERRGIQAEGQGVGR